MSNTKIWDALSKTDPAHTKTFRRAGGFSGTALKPMWMVKRLTEQFGPVGSGWGMKKPSFQVVPAADGETVVYCTVCCWVFDGTRNGEFYGVGGDKVVAKNKNGLFSDDEAFKKAFTDAVGNAFKFLGVGADIHMGQFDDSKYVEQVAEEFANEGYAFPDGPAKNITDLKGRARLLWREIEGCGDASELEPLLETDEVKPLLAQLAALENPSHRTLWEGDGKDNPGVRGLIERKKKLFDMNAISGGKYQENDNA